MSEEIRVIESLVLKHEADRAMLWRIYQHGFSELNKRTPIHHGAWDEPTFHGVLQDEDFTKYVVMVDQDLAGVCILTANLGKIPWINAAFYHQRFPEAYAAGQLFFLPAVVIDPKHQDLRRIGAMLLHEAVAPLGSNAVLAVDFCETLRQSLPAFVNRSLRRDFQSEVLDRLVYQVFYETPV
ncbi:hypothetical protein JW848_08980 [Candidatus Bipolaricaulota bacterium]|nr:hypothetical protein [Candidatus Bipolaricaulota bacterium]